MINKITGFHIEPTNICTLKCEGCARTQFINQWPQHWKNQSIDVDDLMRFFDINLSGLSISLCGVYGDPIYHSKFHYLLEMLKYRGGQINIITNGSYQNKEWWIKTASLLDSQDSITFAIDGTPENFTMYRKNANWESIKTGISIMAATKCRTIWKYIPFLFNQDTINSAQKLAIELGVDEFKLDYSDRFDGKTEHLIPRMDLIGKNYNSQSNFKIGKALSVDPKCQSGREHFISSSGHYVPCCYVNDYRFYYKTIFGKNQNRFEIKKTTISEILQQEETIEFYKTIPQISACQFNCPNTK